MFEYQRHIGLLSTKTLLKEYIDNTEQIASRTVGNKRYELKDHLGNVRATVTDRRLLAGMPEVLSANNYYPFGMLQPQNSYMAGDYRFGLTEKKWITRHPVQETCTIMGLGYTTRGSLSS